MSTSNDSDQAIRAKRFLGLHNPGELFVLANCWNLLTARLFEQEGFSAIGTSSYAVAMTTGVRDGQKLGLDHTIKLVRILSAGIGLPVSVDLERGYGETVDQVVESVRQVLKAGVVGINIEDSTGNPSLPFYDAISQCEKIRAIREMANSTGIHLVINARTDMLLHRVNDPASALKETISRGRAYMDAGADCIFVPDMGDMTPETIRSLTKEIGAPINIIAGVNTPSIAELNKLGVARVSLGPRVLRAGLGLYHRIAREILDRGTFKQMHDGAMSFDDANRLLGSD